MRKILYIAAIAVLFVQNEIYAQNYLWLTTGKKIQVASYKIEDPELISYTNLKGKSKTIQSSDIFSINESTGKELIIYSPDTAIKDVFTVPEMRSYVKGQFDASQNFKSPWTKIGGIVVGAASPAIVPPYYIILVSTGYCATIGLTKPKEHKLNIPVEFSKNEYYKSGYKKEVKQKRIKNAIVGSGIGLVVGLISYPLIYGK